MIIVDVNDKITRSLNHLESKMSSLAEEIQSLQTALNSAQDRVTADLQQLHGQIDDLKGQVATLQDSLKNSTLSPDQQAALDAVVSGLNNLDVPAAPQPTPQPMQNRPGR